MYIMHTYIHIYIALVLVNLVLIININKLNKEQHISTLFVNKIIHGFMDAIL